MACGSAASALGRNRNSQSTILTAPTMDAIATALGVPGHDQLRHHPRSYEDMALFDGTPGCGQPVGHLDGGNGLRRARVDTQSRVRLYGRRAHRWRPHRARERLGGLAVNATEGESTSPCSTHPVTPRTDLVRMFHPPSLAVDGSVLSEADSGAQVPYVLEPQSHHNHRPFGVWITFLAKDIPAIGYARYILTPCTGTSSEESSRVNGNRLETDGLAVELNLVNGSHTPASLPMAGNSRSNAPFGFGAYIHGPLRLGNEVQPPLKSHRRADPWILGSRGNGTYAHVTSAVSNGVFDQVACSQTVQGADWLETTLTAPRGADRIHLSYHLIQTVDP